MTLKDKIIAMLGAGLTLALGVSAYLLVVPYPLLGLIDIIFMLMIGFGVVAMIKQEEK